MRIIVGTYTTGRDSDGLYGLNIDESGRFDAPRLLTQAVDPSFVIADIDLNHIYAVSECSGTGGVYGFNFNEDGMTPDTELSSNGVAPCHLALSDDGEWLAVANYMDGVVCIIRLADGRLTEDVTVIPGRSDACGIGRQECSHAHMALFVNGELWISDLGCDMIRRIVRSGGGWSEAEPVLRLPAGAGPRHFALNDDGVIFVISELDSRLRSYAPTDNGYKLHGDIALSRTARARAQTDSNGEVISDVGAGALRVYGDTLICTVRQDNAVCVVERNGAKLHFVADYDCGGANPRDAVLVGGHIVVANQDNGGLVSLDMNGNVIDRAAITAPVCVLGY